MTEYMGEIVYPITTFHYGTVLQSFTGVMTFVMLFTNSINWFQFVSLHHIAAVV